MIIVNKEEHSKIIEMFKNGESTSSIAKKYGVYKTTIRSILIKNGIDTSIHSTKITEQEKEGIIRDYLKFRDQGYVAKLWDKDRSNICHFLKKNNIETGSFAVKKIASLIIKDYLEDVPPQIIYKKYGVSYSSVYKLLKSKNIKKINHAKRKYKINKKYFDKIDSEHKAYFLGLFFADGCNWGYGIDIALQEGDEYLLQELRKEIYPNNDNPLKKRLPKSKNHKVLYRLVIGSTDIANDLTKHGGVKKKSLIIKYPHGSFDHSLFRHFLRGFFDGDGSIFIDSKKKRLHFNLVAPHDFLYEIKKEMERELKEIISNRITLNGNICSFSLSKTRILCQIYHLMYDEATIFMKRKKNVFDLYYS